MAHVEKYGAVAVAPMLGHYERRAELEHGYQRDNIDPTRTQLNYTVGDAIDLKAEIDRCVERHNAAGRAIRGDAVLMADWVITRPEDVPNERTREFFERTLEYMRERYGRENVPVGYVHMDERTPHMHAPVIPFNREEQRFQASKIITRQDLQTFHRDLGDALERRMGYRPRVELTMEQKQERAIKYTDLGEYKRAMDAVRQSQEQAREAERLRLEADERKREAVKQQKMESERLESLRRDRSETERRIEDVRGRVRSRKGAFGSFDREGERVAERVGNLERERDGVIERTRGLERKVDEAKREVVQREKEIERCARSRTDAEGRVDGLREQLRLLRERIERSRQLSLVLEAARDAARRFHDAPGGEKLQILRGLSGECDRGIERVRGFVDNVKQEIERVGERIRHIEYAPARARIPELEQRIARTRDAIARVPERERVLRDDARAARMACQEFYDRNRTPIRAAGYALSGGREIHEVSPENRDKARVEMGLQPLQEHHRQHWWDRDRDTDYPAYTPSRTHDLEIERER